MIASQLIACLLISSPGVFQGEATARGTVFIDTNGNRQLDADERGLAGVGVSNGRDVVETDAQGRYAITIDNDDIVFVIKPTGYRTHVDDQELPRFYYIHKPSGSPRLKFRGVDPTGALPETIDFPLSPQKEDGPFNVILFGDPQPRDQQEVDYIAHDVVEQIVGTQAAFGVTLGDIMFDNLDLFTSLNRTIAHIGVPWYNVVGNHDIDFASPSDEFSDEVFERIYGPPYYSFDYGGVHFLVIDDVDWKTTPSGKEYKTGVGEDQFDFIRNDLARVPQERLVVVMMHIPLIKSTPWRSMQREKLFRILETRDHCISFSGHTHHHEHTFLSEADGWHGKKPHHHVITVTVSGAWWSGARDEEGIPHTMCADGTPNGYAIARFEGNEYSVDYRAARRPASYQIRVSAPEVVTQSELDKTPVFANVFNAWPDATVELQVGDHEWQAMKKLSRHDPIFVAMAEREAKIEEHPWRDAPKPMACPHLWTASLPAGLSAGSHAVRIRAKNPNGQTYSAVRVLRVE